MFSDISKESVKTKSPEKALMENGVMNFVALLDIITRIFLATFFLNKNMYSENVMTPIDPVILNIRTLSIKYFLSIMSLSK